MGTQTGNWNFNLPSLNGDDGNWGALLNENWERLDAILINDPAADNEAYARVYDGVAAFWVRTYTKTEIDASFALYYTQAQVDSNYYTKTEIDADWYTAVEVDALLSASGSLPPDDGVPYSLSRTGSATDWVSALAYPQAEQDTSTGYTLQIEDAGSIVEMNNASANTVTIPPNSSVAFVTNTRIDIVQYGAGDTSIVAGSGVTVRGNLNVSAQYGAVSLWKRDEDEWVVFGGTVA